MRLGLTGGLGSGKSSVAAFFRERGWPTLDMDCVARTITQPGQPAIALVAREFGSEILNPDGALDRQAMSRIVFRDDRMRRRLETILHPVILAKSERWVIEQARLARPVVVLEIPLLFEVGLEHTVDRIVLVTAPMDVRLQRLSARGIDPVDALARIAVQMPDEAKSSRSHFVIENNTSLEALRVRVDAVAEAILSQRMKSET